MEVITMVKIPIVRITTKPFMEFKTDIRMEEFNEDSVPKAKAETERLIAAGIKNGANVRHTIEIVWVNDYELE